MRAASALGVVLLGGLAVGPGAAGAATAATGASVTISGVAYHPASLVVHPGDTVTWTNNDQIGHSVTADDGSFDSAQALCGPGIALGCIQPGQSYSHTFVSSGTFIYHCRVHSSMHGSVVVAAVPVTAPPTTVHVTASSLSTTSTSLGLAPGSPGGPPTSLNDGSIGQDLPPSTAPGASVALNGPSGKKSSSGALTVVVLTGCILLASAGIGAVVYRIRADRRLGP